MNNGVGKLTKWHEAVAKNHLSQLIKDVIFIMCDVLKYFSINIVRIMLKKKKRKKMWKYSHDLAEKLFCYFFIDFVHCLDNFRHFPRDMNIS